MLILSLDAASAGCASCVWRDGAVLALRTETMARGQDSRLVPLVLEVLAEAGVGFKDLDRLAVTRGPGSFTGLRIGLATARGFGLAAGKPVFGIDRLALYRQRGPQADGGRLVLLDSRRQELFAQLCWPDRAPEDPCFMTEEGLRRLLAAHPSLALIGDVAQWPEGFVPEGARALPSTEPEVVGAAVLAAVADAQDPAFAPRPLYLRAPDVTLRAGAV